MKEMCQNFICDTGVTGPDKPQTPPTAVQHVCLQGQGLRRRL